MIYVYKYKKTNIYYKCQDDTGSPVYTPKISDARQYILDSEHAIDYEECAFVLLKEELKNIRKRKINQLQNDIHLQT